MREIRIAVNLNESTETEAVYNAGLMFEHNTTKLIFELEETLIKADYKYYLDFATPSGIVRTDYLVPDETGALSFLLPAAVTSQMSVICCLNIIRVNESTYETEEVIKPKLIRLSFSTVEGDSKELAESYDFSINAMLEAIKSGDFKGEKGDKGDTGAKGEKGDKGDTGTVIADSQLNSESSNPVENKAVTAALDKKVDKTNGMGLSSNDFTDEYKLKIDSAEKTANKITEFTGAQTDEQYPSAKLVYDNFILSQIYTDNGLAQKVDKASGKMLSTNDFTNSLKQKLNGIESGANKTITDSALSSTSVNPVENKVITAALNKKLNYNGGVMSGNLGMGGNNILSVKKITFLTKNGELLDMSNHPIANLATPTADYHAANKKYVDDTVNSIPKTVDAELSDTSENAVQSKAIKSYIDGKKISQIVDCPAFTNQPTITEAQLNSAFVPWNVNYYYVHIVDSTAGTFKLMTEYNDSTSCIDQTFTLSGLNTGNSGVLSENSLVDFLTVGTSWKMRNAGIKRLEFKTNSKNINIKFNGFSDRSGYMHIDNIAGINNDYCFATGALSNIYVGAQGFPFGKVQYTKNILLSGNVNINLQSNYIDFSGQYFYTKLQENDRTKPVSKYSTQTVKGVCYKKDAGALLISEISGFFLLADGQFLNGAEVTVIGKES